MKEESATGNHSEDGEMHCAECNRLLTEEDDHEMTEGGVFCRSCFDNLKTQIKQALDEQSKNINYPMAFVGGLGGGILGVLVWWGFTVVTEIAFGLVAVVIGFTVAKGALLLSGGKRSQGLQIMSALIAFGSFFYACYLVNRTFIQDYLAEQGEQAILPLLPNLELFVEVLKPGFGVMDIVFLAIVVWQAWKLSAPHRSRSMCEPEEWSDV
jgi:hypothetical protein